MTSPPLPPGPPADLAVIANWMLHQRWYANKGALPMLEEIGRWAMPTDAAGVQLVTHFLLDHTPGRPALYQVPLSYRDAPLEGPTAIGRGDAGWIYDAPADPAFAPAVLAFMGAGIETTGWRTWALGSAPAGAPAGELKSRVLGGEQSNTSFVVEPVASDETSGEQSPVICKVFRAIHDGDNPDVVLQGALSAAGSTAVPRAIGHVVGEWPDRGQATGRARGHLIVAQEFLPGARDGWLVALEAARSGADFAERARSLGIVTAGIHATLAATLPTEPAGTGDIAAALAAMAGRLSAAIEAVPELGALSGALSRVLAGAGDVDWPDRQRVHGDLHLGQVLDVPDRGWIVVDFEGEPLRPMSERSQLDNPLRDVAGMLRSFDYVAGSLSITAGIDARAWAHEAREAFAGGYSEASGRDLQAVRPLLDALEADKALYEAVYEARNRPAWLAIPVQAIERLAQPA